MYQVNPAYPPRETLPTMYDLPSEEIGEPGLPDEFHRIQLDFLTKTCKLPTYPDDQVFIGSDLNFYYDAKHLLWYKRPDWFLVVGATKASWQEDLRWSYVIWQERARPFLMIELLSPGTEAEDLGQTLREANRPPTKWEVYEQILQVPYYVVYDRYDHHFRAFRLNGDRYQELDLSNQRLWFDELQLGLGLWDGEYDLATGLWLRWYDAGGNWVPTPEEQAERERQWAQQEHQRAEQEHQRAEQERQRAEQERQRAEQECQRAEQAEQQLEQERELRQNLLNQLRLLNPEQLRSLGIDPGSLDGRSVGL